MAAAVNQTGQSMRNVVGLCLVDVKAATVITLKICRFGIVNVLMGLVICLIATGSASVAINIVIFRSSLLGTASQQCRSAKGVLLRRLTLEVQSVLVIFAKALMSVSVTCRGRYSLLPTL